MDDEKLDTKLQCKLTATNAAIIMRIAAERRIEKGKLVRHILEDWIDAQTATKATAVNEDNHNKNYGTRLAGATNAQLIAELQRRLIKNITK
jgi:S-adenosylmethionine:diacylglycerol 3-amino-3-carboxypropyl transferase